MKTNCRVLATLSMLLIAALVCAEESRDAGENDDPLRGLEYRLIGPAAGGRVSRVAGVPGDPLTYYTATAAGGVWKSVNGGREWKSVFDDQPVSSVGSIAVAPSDPNVVWVGSGEANIRGNVGEGNGIYRSTDAGATWKRVWTAEGQIGTIAVHPDNPDVAFAAVLGSPFGPGPDRGVFRTTDGGTNVGKGPLQRPGHRRLRCLFSSFESADPLCRSVADPALSVGDDLGRPGSGLYVSRDGGDSWKRLEAKGLPGGIWGRVGVRVAESEPKRVYALIEAEEGGLFRSDNGGKKWTRISASRVSASVPGTTRR